MILYYLFNDHHKNLVDDFFMPTLIRFNKNCIEPIGLKIPEPQSKLKFGTADFKKMTTYKAKTILNLTNLELNPFIVSDVDIQFFRSIKEEIKNALKLEKDIVFQKESEIHGSNTGFMLIRPNERSRRFWDEVVDGLESEENDKINDQHIANRLLRKKIVKHDQFPSKIWAYSQGDPRKDMILHHANCTMNTEAKVRQLNRIKRFMKA